ncbi:hypothetical protein E2562_032862 [Oryza meyeriana var. granulata]|uniref:Uncharacterized protein n=1 Tax=Oryza meyeriana var. granulata TaxID=110450 RepID=A0A6G1BP60_9ORYZ|nr:hypothetical protein E2562_032862 [Oryza meyeriana var. granulata]
MPVRDRVTWNALVTGLLLKLGLNKVEPGATPPQYVSSDAISGEDDASISNFHQQALHGGAQGSPGYAPLAGMQQQHFIGSFRLNHETAGTGKIPTSE